MSRNIVRINDDGWVGLTYDDTGYYELSQLMPIGNPSAAEYAKLCDQAAESENQHSFCGVHILLLELLNRHHCEPLPIMKDIAELGGLFALRKENEPHP
jgi:hypothetical protein